MIGLSSLFSLPEGLEVEGIELQGNLLAVAIVSVLPFSCCPLCSQASSQVHSWYQRTLRDVPCAGRQAVLHLSVRKFFCRNPDCARKIFTERLPTFVEPWAQVTRRLFEAVQAVGFATSGELGTRLADRIGIHSSPTTMLRRMMALSSPSSCQVSLLGIDDWSFRRGRKFGTLLVDLATHRVLDLLPDRNAESAAAWMREHPEIKVVSRDRGGEYASAAVAGAPQAIQCADRFHMLKNLGEVLEGLLARHLATKRQKKIHETLEEHIPIEQATRSVRRSRHQWSVVKHAYREERLARYEQVRGFAQTWDEPGCYCQASGHWSEYRRQLAGGLRLSRDHTRSLCEPPRPLSALSVSAVGVGVPQYGSPPSRTRGTRVQRVLCQRA